MTEKLSKRSNVIDRRSAVIAAVFLWCVCAGVPAVRAQEPETRKEFWPEVDVYVHVKPRVRLFFLATVSKAVEDGEFFHAQGYEAQFGAHVDFIPNKFVVLRTGYRYGTAIGDNEPFKEHRFLTEQTFRKPLPGGLLLSDRNREDFRWVDGKFSFRYRNRVTLERSFELIKGRPTTPYASFEGFYDTRYDTWNRTRLRVGFEQSVRNNKLSKLLLPNHQAVVEIYFLRQHDTRSATPRVNALGAALSLYF